MKTQKGFIVPLLLTIIAVLVIGGGAYVYKNQTKFGKVTISSITPSSGPSGTKIIISGSGFKQGDKIGWAGGTPANAADTSFAVNSISSDGKQIEFIIPPLEDDGNVKIGTYHLYIIYDGNKETSYLPFIVTKDEIVNWKTYTNTKYGYQIQYPENAVASTSNPSLIDIQVLIKNGKIHIGIINPCQDLCASFGPGAADIHFEESFVTPGGIYKGAGFIGDGKIYSERFNKDDKSYGKSGVICIKDDCTFTIRYGYDFKVLLDRGDIDAADTLLRKIISTFTLTK